MRLTDVLIIVLSIMTQGEHTTLHRTPTMDQRQMRRRMDIGGTVDMQGAEVVHLIVGMVMIIGTMNGGGIDRPIGLTGTVFVQM